MGGLCCSTFESAVEVVKEPERCLCNRESRDGGTGVERGIIGQARRYAKRHASERHAMNKDTLRHLLVQYTQEKAS